MSIISLCKIITCAFLPKDIAGLIAEYSRDDNCTQAKQLIQYYIQKTISLPLHNFTYCINSKFRIPGIGFIDTEQKTPYVRITIVNDSNETECSLVYEIQDIVNVIANKKPFDDDDVPLVSARECILWKIFFDAMKSQLQVKIMYGL